MEKTGLLLRIHDAALAIDYGRKGFETRGKAEEGRLSYEHGVAAALSAFKDARSTSDPEIIILVEYTFLNQELEFCEKTDTDSFSSLTKAIQSFDDAFLSLEAVEDTAYKIADKTYPHNNSKYRVKEFPKDSYHIAMIAHQTRLRNNLRTPGIDPIEKALLKQRYVNLAAGQKGYCVKQGKALQISSEK